MKPHTVKILLIDDDEDDYVLTRDLLMDMNPTGYQLDWSHNPQTAIDSFKNNNYDLYLIDYKLGQMTGIDLIRLAREAGCTKPIIILTGKGDHQIDLEAMQLGASDYLVKDRIDGYTLEKAIRYAVERWQSTEALRRSEEKYRNIFEKSNDVIYTTNHTGNFIDLNESACRLFGYSREELLKMNAVELYWDENDRRRFRELINAKQEIIDFEVMLKTKSGDRIYCLLNTSIQPHDNEDGYVYQGLIHDITKRKKHEQDMIKAEKLEVSSRIARIIAHEIRNPLMNIDLSLSQLNDLLTKDEDTGTYFDIISRNSKRINELVGDLLNSSKPRLLQIVPTPINTVIDEVLDLAKDRLMLKGIHVEKDYGDDLCHVKVDIENMKIALLNIVINAIEAMKQDEGILNVRTRAVEHICSIEISDNGLGIAPENLVRLFDPYYTSKPNGMGLGLTSTQNIILTHKGTLNVESEMGHGTTFIITLERNLMPQ